MVWWVPFDKLGQKQVEILNGITRDLDQTHWVQGFAGTGKTLVVTHLMERVANSRATASICFITYTHALKDLVSSGLQPSVARRVSIKTHTAFLKDNESYDFVFLDEVQDIGPVDLSRILALSGHLYVAGDTDQRLYEAGSNETQISRAIKPKKWQLLEIFRLTKLLQQVAQAILPKTRLIEGLHAGNKKEVTIQLVKHVSSAREVAWVWREASKRARSGDPSVILFPTHRAIAAFASELAHSLELGANPPRTEKKDYTDFNEFWRRKKVNLMYFGNSHGDLNLGSTQPMTYLMTFHSSKGLDFKNVFIPGMGTRAVIVSQRALETDPELEQRLLFVAVTRSRENLFISYCDPGPHRLLRNLPAEVVASWSADDNNAQDDEEEFF